MDIFNKFKGQLEEMSINLKEMSSEALTSAQGRMHEIKDDRQRNFLQESLEKAQKGELSQTDFLTQLKKVQDAS